MLRPDTIDRLVGRFARGDVDAVCGVQAAEMRHRDLASLYKNLWIRWTYLRATGDVPLFYTTAAAIRRSEFRRAGGFDAGYATPSIEDTAFGQELARLGVRVRVQPDLEVEHVKRYSLGSLLRTDFRRAVALVRLKLRHRHELGENNSSVPRGTSRASRSWGSGRPRCWPARPSGGRCSSRRAWAWPRSWSCSIASSSGPSGSMGAGIAALASVALLWLELLVAGVGAGFGLLGFSFGNRY